MAKTLFDKVAPHLLWWLGDEPYSALEFLSHNGRLPRLRAPQTFNEKILWLMHHYRDDRVRKCSDKLLVREYVRDAVSEEVLIPLLGVYDAPSEIRLESLPDAFILKATHGSGWNIICRQKSTFEFAPAAGKLSRWLRTNYARLGREWNYEGLEPRIVCEPLLLNAQGKIPPDYKVFCFHGEPGFIQVDYDRHGARTRNLYDPEWRLLPCQKNHYPNNPRAASDAPAALSEMLALARRLSKPFPFVRVDLYAVENRVLFGELTFHPDRGMGPFRPARYDEQYGRLLDLGRIREHVV